MPFSVNSALQQASKASKETELPRNSETGQTDEVGELESKLVGVIVGDIVGVSDGFNDGPSVNLLGCDSQIMESIKLSHLLHRLFGNRK